MPRFHETNNGPVQFTVEEETARDAEEAAFEAGRAAMEARQEITRLESEVTQRRIRDAFADPAWMNAQEAKIKTERDKL
jgi:hypothetical protein